MKIFTDNKVYVQIIDLKTILKNNISISNSLFNKISRINIDDKFEFIVFTEPDEINFFKNCNWIINYDDYKNLSEDEIIIKAQEILEKFNILSKQNNNYAKKDFCTTEHELLSVRDFLWFKQGRLIYNMPDDVEEIKFSIQNNKPILRRIFEILI